MGAVKQWETISKDIDETGKTTKTKISRLTALTFFVGLFVNVFLLVPTVFGMRSIVSKGVSAGKKCRSCRKYSSRGHEKS